MLRQEIRTWEETILSQDMYDYVWELRDSSDMLRRLEFQPDGLLIDGLPYSIEVSSEEPDSIRFVGHPGVIACTPHALWRAFGGEQVQPQPFDAGQLIAENMLLWDRLRHWRSLFQTIQTQLREPLEQSLYQLSLPRPRLDPFTEELLGRCDANVAPAQVRAIAALLRCETAIVVQWLRERGKQIAWLAPVQATDSMPIDAIHKLAEGGMPGEGPALPDGGRSQPEPERQANQAQPVEEQKTSREEPQQESATLETASHPTRTEARRGKPRKARSIKKVGFIESAPERVESEPEHPFLWTKDRLRELDEAFYALNSDVRQDVGAAACQIADQHQWSPNTVEEKIRDLRLDQPGRLLRRGSFVWTVNVGGARQTWALDYPYGQFPLASGDSFRYQDQVYLLLHAWSNQLLVQPEAQESASLDVHSAHEEELRHD
ncbi:hypothetical protein [Ktedonospora formicarum]|uniref:Uncharacterized protein n=1 Tax=Ktedonospora formicarum TaxID=2778364 RepID=A0A8J3IA45_9CHLR|nr:hypothetical protein [Ktedonospora formicarum]GHO51411.1 hypothetical protein KSX_95740 [Ktedonospora formicarum]